MIHQQTIFVPTHDPVSKLFLHLMDHIFHNGSAYRKKTEENIYYMNSRKLSKWELIH